MSHDPELALLLACAGWPPSPARVAAVRRAAAADIDWPRFVAVVARHRMAGMAASGLSAAGVPVPPGVRDAAQADLVQALATLRAALRLVAGLEAAGIACVVLKGPPLAAGVYGTPAVRQLRDLDLLVDPADRRRAAALLAGEGYVARPEGGGGKGAKDEVFVHPHQRLTVELHVRLSDNPALPPLDWRDVAPVPVAPGRTLPALTGQPLLRYLALHGFRHGWERLKWLADVAAIVAALPGGGLAGGASGDGLAGELHAFVRDLEARRLGVVAHSTLLLLRDAMGLMLPPDIEARARASRRARWCAALAARRLRDPRDPGEHGWLATATAGSLFLASTAPAYLAREIVRQGVDAPLAQRLGGGRAGTALSMALRPLAWSARKVSRARNAGARP